VQLNAGVDFQEKTVPEGSVEAGSKIATVYDGPNTIHAMILAGYNDDVYLDPAKKGAFLLVNSYGASWGHNGTMWIPYDKFVTETEVYFLEVVKHTPRLEYKVTLQGYGKNGGRFTSGFSSDILATAPEKTQGYGGAFSGNTGTFTGEIGLDCSTFWKTFSGNSETGRFFLESRGTGTIASLSLMMYDETGRVLVKEIKCPQRNVPVGTTMSIVIEQSVAVKDPLSDKPPVNLTLRKRIKSGYELYVPYEEPSRVSVKDLQGRHQFSFTSNKRRWYCLPGKLMPGVSIVTVDNGKKRLVERLNIVQ